VTEDVPDRDPTPECVASCLIVLKFNDVNANGLRDEDEPMLSDMRFDVHAGGVTYPGTTDDAGRLRMCFAPGTRVDVEELIRAGGGLWSMTTSEDDMDRALPCGDTEVWVGNTMLQLPHTGDGIGRRGASSPAGPARLY
jgi:hypothetical protein